MTELSRAQGCLLGLACGDALGRPVEFNTEAAIEAEHGAVTEMLGHGTHGQPPGTVTDDTEMALRVADSLIEQQGFDPADIGDKFVAWLDTEPFDIGLMTRDSLSRLRNNTPWHTAGVEVWEDRPEGSNAGNGSVMRCAPHAIAFRQFHDELTYVSRLSSAITHADPRCQWGCVFLNRTLANLILDVEDPLQSALNGAYAAPDELRTELERVVEAQRATDPTEFEQQLSTSGYVVDSLQTALYDGLTADSVEAAVTRAVNRGGDTDTIGAIAGAVAGARFGHTNIPDRWRNELNEADSLKQRAERLLAIRQNIPQKDGVTLDDGSLILKERTVEGPTYISASEFQEATIGHRPHPAPHRTLNTRYRDVTPQSAAMIDWERRAYAVYSGRASAYSPHLSLDTDDSPRGPDVVQVPQYPFVGSFDELPAWDQDRILGDAREAARAFIRSYRAFTAIRHPITEMEIETVGIERVDPIAGATRVLSNTYGELGDLLLSTRVGGGYAVPEQVTQEFAAENIEEVIMERPRELLDAAEQLGELESETGALLDYVVHVESASEPAGDGKTSVTEVETLKEEARTAVRESALLGESLHRVAVRHPEVDFETWNQLRE